MSREISIKEMHEILDRFKRGECSAAENAKIIKWYNLLGENVNDHFDEETSALIKQKLWVGITTTIDAGKNELFEKRPFYLRPYFQIAASISIIFLLLVSLLQLSNNQLQVTKSENSVLAPQHSQMFANDSKRVKMVLLNDGTSVQLQPHASISFTTAPNTNQRIAVLEGEAFFDVFHDKTRPFSVYSGGIVTRVLGTSFSINKNKRNGEIVVSVRSGRVSVTKENSQKSSAKKAEVILTPNQKAIYSAKMDKITTSIVAHPVMLKETDSQKLMEFDETPVSEILTKLENLYGINIEFDRAKLIDCRITVVFLDEDLFERLTLISKLIGASYTVSNTEVVFASQGCK
ncbi:hypothetical protein GCM10028809_63250 [Spirosoma gilvum]